MNRSVISTNSLKKCFNELGEDYLISSNVCFSYFFVSFFKDFLENFENDEDLDFEDSLNQEV